MDDIKQRVRKLDVISSLDSIIKMGCDCSFFYWTKILLGNYFSDIYDNPEEVEKLPYMFAALGDVIPCLRTIVHVESMSIIANYEKEILALFENNVLNPLCQKIEEDLRFHIHTHLNVSTRDPFKSGVRDFATLVNAQPFRFHNQIISIKGKIIFGNFFFT